ncbi:MAG: hemerythrin family protein [Gammaproteobacteria bacterium]|nr:hemerythrin family protein [Gammaproteobacteria bacterium]
MDEHNMMSFSGTPVSFPRLRAGELFRSSVLSRPTVEKVHDRRVKDSTKGSVKMVVGAGEKSRLDAQHRQLDELARAACRTLRDEHEPTEFRGPLVRFMNFAAAHFKEEENVMRRFSYRGLETHKRTHDLLYNRCVELESETFIFDEDSKVRLLNFILQEFRYHEFEDRLAWKAMAN